MATPRSAAVVTAVALLAPACTHGDSERAAARPPPTVTRVRELLTVFACPGKPRTTLEIEGCAQREVRHSGRAAEARRRAVFRLLSPVARRSFAAGERAWLVYRDNVCNAEASEYDGGSHEPTAYYLCVADQNRRHANELAALERKLRTEG